MGKCTEADINNQIEPARQTGQMYSPVDIVIRKRVKDEREVWKIVFTRYGDAEEKRFEAEWNNTNHMWTPCPSEFERVKDGEPPPENSTARLYMSSTFTADLFATPEPKWPPRLAANDPVTKSLSVYPLKLELTALELRSGKLRKLVVDLLDADKARAQQTISLDGTSALKVHFTKAVFKELGLRFTPEKELVARALKLLSDTRIDAEDRAWAWSVVADAAHTAASPDAAREIGAELARDLRKFLGFTES